MESSNMPLTFQMALAHNQKALSSFLSMPNDKQEFLIREAKNQKTVREMNIFVNSIAKTY